MVKAWMHALCDWRAATRYEVWRSAKARNYLFSVGWHD